MRIAIQKIKIEEGRRKTEDVRSETSDEKRKNKKVTNSRGEVSSPQKARSASPCRSLFFLTKLYFWVFWSCQDIERCHLKLRGKKITLGKGKLLPENMLCSVDPG
jgi:hypothetical protein